jgi:formylmethanofuran dehydrogenase subunit E
MKIKILLLALVFLLLQLKAQSQESVRQSEEFLSRAAEFHGHLGPYLVLGLKAGFYANQVLGKDPMKTEATIETRTVPPQSCSVDGVQFSTGCTMGKGNISVKEGKGLLITFKKDNRELVLQLKKEIIEQINSLPPDKEEAWENLARDLYKRKTEEIFEIFNK